MSTPGDILFVSFFDHHCITVGTLKTTPHTGMPENRIKLYNYHDVCLISLTRNGNSLDTSKEATAVPYHVDLNVSAPSTPPVPAAAAPRVTITSFSSGIIPLTGTGSGATDNPYLTSSVPRAPTTGTGTCQSPEAQAATSKSPGKGPEVSSAAPESPVTTAATSGETILPDESGRTTTGKPHCIISTWRRRPSSVTAAATRSPLQGATVSVG